MESYCESQVRLAERLIDAGLDREACHMLFLLKACAAQSDCAYWRKCVARTAGAEVLRAGGPLH